MYPGEHVPGLKLIYADIKQARFLFDNRFSPVAVGADLTSSPQQSDNYADLLGIALTYLPQVF